MSSSIYDQVFMVPAAKDRDGWQPGNDNRDKPELTSKRSKISIAWWLVPCVMVWAVSVLVVS